VRHFDSILAASVARRPPSQERARYERELTEALRYLGLRVVVRGGDTYLLREIFAEDASSLGEHTILSVTELAGALESIG
jgi:hypothetical protein